MGYVVAAYALVVASLAGYAWWIQRGTSRLRDQLELAEGRKRDGG